jgi:predicted secreted acid phosphatase
VGIGHWCRSRICIRILVEWKKVNEMGDDLSNIADKFKDKINDSVDKGKEVLNDIKETINNNSAHNA